MRSKLISDFLNPLDNEQAYTALEKCCGSVTWVARMNDRRPFQNDDEVAEAACSCWDELDRPKRMEAFAAHPQIGDMATLRCRYSNTEKWATVEQADVEHASDAVIKELARQNDAYFKKFGYIFIVCASGLSGIEMLKILKERLPNDADTEFQIASNEQIKITQLRLGKLIQNE